jgi:tRNA threonylcarbamoyladenosine biosynthesis protein TsaE
MIENSNTYITLTHSPEQTEAMGASLAEELLRDASLPRFVALYGDLGVGKTAFVRGFTSRIVPNATVKSPTFALVNEYRSKDARVYHFDMYRIVDEEDLYSIGFYDYLNSGAICLCEWSENIPYAIPGEHVRVTISKTDPASPDERKIELKKP